MDWNKWGSVGPGPTVFVLDQLIATWASPPVQLILEERFGPIRSIPLVQYTHVNLFSKRPFDWLLSIFLPNEFRSCILSSVDFSIWPSLVVMKTKNVFLRILTYYKLRQRKQEGPWPWIAHLCIQAKVKHLTLKSEWPLTRSKNDLDLWYSLNFINLFSWMLQATLRPKAAIVSKK